jgi:hypothetical protein
MQALRAHTAHTCTLRLSPCRGLALEWGWFSQVRCLARVYYFVVVGWMCCVVQVLAAVLDIVPPLIPPPVWNNQPLPCAPMLTGVIRSGCGVAAFARDAGSPFAGHVCFGAVLYPITMADFTIADVTDGMLDGPPCTFLALGPCPAGSPSLEPCLILAPLRLARLGQGFGVAGPCLEHGFWMLLHCRIHSRLPEHLCGKSW